MIFQALRIRSYRFFVYAQILSQLGDTGYRFMFMAFITQILCNNGFKFSANTLAINVLAYCVLAPYAGFLADRWNKKKIMVFCGFAKMIILFFSMWFRELYILSSTNSLLILTVLSSSIDIFFFFLASQATLSHLVPKKYLFQANSLNQIIQTLSPTLSLGLMFFYIKKIHEKMDDPVQYSQSIGLITALLYLASTYFFKKLPDLNIESKPPKAFFIQETVKCLKKLTSQKVFIYIFIVNVILLVSQICLSITINQLSQGSAVHSLTLKSYCVIYTSLGGFIGTILLSILNLNHLGYGLALGTLFGSLGFSYLLFYNTFFELIFPLVVGLITSFITIPLRTYIQQNISLEYQAKSFSIMESTAYGVAGIITVFITKPAILYYGIHFFVWFMSLVYFVVFNVCFFNKTMREIKLSNDNYSEDNSYVH